MPKKSARASESDLLKLLEDLLKSGQDLPKGILDDPEGLQRLNLKLAKLLIPRMNRVDQILSLADVKGSQAVTVAEIEDIKKLLIEAMECANFSAQALHSQQGKIRRLREEKEELLRQIASKQRPKKKD